MGFAEDRRTRADGEIAAQVAERIGVTPVAVIQVTWAGMTGAALGFGSLTGVLKKRAAKKQAPGLPRGMFLAATDSEIVALRRSDLLRMKEEVARWPIATTRVVAHPKGMVTRRIELHPAAGEAVALETIIDKHTGAVVEDFLAAVGASSA